MASYTQMLRNLLPMGVLLMMATIRRDGVFADAHSVSIENALPANLSVECFDPSKKDPATRREANIITPGSVLSFTITDVSKTRMCGFSWLGTAKVKRFLAWERDACDSCYWKVESSGFCRKLFDGSFQQMYSWQSTCYSS